MGKTVFRIPIDYITVQYQREREMMPCKVGENTSKQVSDKNLASKIQKKTVLHF